MRGVGHEAPLRLERGLQACEQVVEGASELLELIVGALDVQALVQIGRGDVPGRRCDRAQGPQQPTGDQPAEAECQHDSHREHERKEDVHMMTVAGSLGLGVGDRTRGRPGRGFGAGSIEQAPDAEHGDEQDDEDAAVEQRQLQAQRAPGQAEARRRSAGQVHHAPPMR